jgi:hypothetical protein
MSHICLERFRCLFFEKNLWLVKIIFLEKFMVVLVDKGQVVCDVNMAELKEVLNFNFFWICTARKGS